MHKFLQIFTLDHLTCRVARVGRDNDLQTLRTNILLYLVHIEAVLVLLVQPATMLLAPSSDAYHLK